MKKNISPEKIRRILVVKPSSLGDILHTFPAIELLHRHFPDARLDWLVHPAFAEVLKFSPFPVHRVIPFNRKALGQLRRMPSEFWKLAANIRRRNYDLVIDFQGLVRSSIFGFLARGPLPVGFARPRERTASFLYGRRLDVRMELHAVERNVALVNAMLGTDDSVPEPVLPTGLFPLTLPPAAEGKILIGLVPGARWQSKSFPAALFAETVKAIRRERSDVFFAVIGGGSDAPAADEIVAAAGNDAVASFAGKTSIGEMIELMSRCRLIVSNDSGPVHAAAALRIPVLGLFGPTRPELTGPYGGMHRIFRLDIDCIACMKRRCPHGDPPRCHRISPEHIAQAALEIINRREK